MNESKKKKVEVDRTSFVGWMDVSIILGRGRFEGERRERKKD